ncbi:LOW QUALITY PROTEIN: uncharacterized protein ACMZJ9_016764 [Mantella aurantiaca]
MALSNDYGNLASYNLHTLEKEASAREEDRKIGRIPEAIEKKKRKQIFKMGKGKKSTEAATAKIPPARAGKTASTTPQAGTTAAEPSRLRQVCGRAPTLEPWMKQTVVLKLKEVDGRIPDLTPEVFGKKCILDQGFTKAETLSVQSFVKGVFYITFMSLHICQRYWEKVKAAGPDSILGKFLANSPIQREERRVTVSMRNPHTPGKDINTFLQRFCTVVKEPSRIPEANGFWTGKWTAVCRLRRYPLGDLQHLPPCYSLGSSAGILHYADKPQTCRRCGKIGHVGRNCSEPACRYCRAAGHEAKDCPRSKTCNLCGLADHIYKDCPQRARTYAGALIRGRPTVTGETETAETTARKDFFQARGRQQVCARKRELRRLQRELQSLQDLHRCGWDVRQDLEDTKNRLKGHFEEESDNVFRSKVEHLEKGEKCNSFFFRKLHSGHIPLSELRDETGTLRKGKEEVMGVVSNFYTNLYSPKDMDPIAADRFLSELFAECIRRNPEIRGITAPGPDRREVKCSLYMDDVKVFCANQRSIDLLVQTCEDFGQASGAKVNCGKSEAMLFGNWFRPSTASIPFNIKPDVLKILGVYFGAEGAALKSWDERLSKMNQKFGLWSLRELTIEGKTLVLRSEILPVLQYLAQAWPPQRKTCRAITKAVFYFIWGSKMDRVKRSVMFKEPAKGGKGVPDIATLLRVFFACNCIRRTLTNTSQKDSAGRSMSRFFLLPLWRSLGWDKWDSSVPYNWDTPWFYLETFKFIKDNELHRVKPDLWKPKTMHSAC